MEDFPRSACDGARAEGVLERVNQLVGAGKAKNIYCMYLFGVVVIFPVVVGLGVRWLSSLEEGGDVGAEGGGVVCVCGG